LPTFRRQHPIGAYVLDFYCAKARLAIGLNATFAATHGSRHAV
jgi:very-short-patch-repair endonuclease